ncbi:MAG: PEP-CTERM sorting domain-containing protein [Planctomycetota bacterium]
MRSFAISVLLLGGTIPSMANADFIVSSWDLLTYVYQGASGEDDYVTSTVVQNPYHTTHFASIGDTTSQTNYDISWLLDFGGFDIQAAHMAEGAEGGVTSALSSGHIWITPTEDLLLSLDAAYSYEFSSSAAMLAGLTIGVSYADQPGGIFGQMEQAVTFPGEPLSGTLAIQADIILPANETWVLGYSTKVHTFSGSAGSTVTGDGHVSFTITPEPTTASLLALGGLMLIRRRRRGRKRRM